ncbi:hypothetical protein POM88_007236 [Heracleum sosnowskyi]|uniref:DUF4216 domain-containing protein n=1 Tax=Heracleum sosnowskyi TaxID=360622 RepID=A0AAD8J511_9APIA|nr:hypothetical protein POM88_007236 [Heracleum sosnowskyi]
MAESYLGEESVEFCQEFVNQSCTTVGLRKDAGKLSGPLSVVTMKPVEEKEQDEAHLHVLLNNPEVHPYIIMHKKYLEEIHQGKKKSGHWLLREHNWLFADWFEKKVSSEMMENDEGVSETIRWLAGKPSFSVLTYESYLVNGVQYFTKERDDVRVVQNSGVSLVANTVQGIKVDNLGFTLVDISRQGHKKDKYVLMDQVKQVFYVEDPVDAKWSVVLTSTTRDYQELYNEDELGDTTMENPPSCSSIPICDVSDDVEHSIRENVEGTWVKN